MSRRSYVTIADTSLWYIFSTYVRDTGSKEGCLITAQASSGQIISSVPPLEWCRLKDTTFIGALEAATAVTDHPFDYETLMGLTGLAFRVRWHQDATGARWLPFSAMGDGPEVIAAVRQTTGWQLRVACEGDGPDGASERFLPEIVAS